MSKSIKLGTVTSSQPIKGYSHRGFVLGWCAIIVVGVMAFGLLTLPLGYTSAALEVSQANTALASFY